MKLSSWLAALCLLFIGLKLAHQIDWSWWLVFAPIWASIIIGVLAVIAWATIQVSVEKKK